MNDPTRPMGWGILKERKLMILVELVILLALILGMSTYHRIVAMRADRAREVAVRP